MKCHAAFYKEKAVGKCSFPKELKNFNIKPDKLLLEFTTELYTVLLMLMCTV